MADIVFSYVHATITIIHHVIFHIHYRSHSTTRRAEQLEMKTSREKALTYFTELTFSHLDCLSSNKYVSDSHVSCLNERSYVLLVRIHLMCMCVVGYDCPAARSLVFDFLAYCTSPERAVPSMQVGTWGG